MEAYGLAQRLAVPVEEAKEILDAFFGAFPSVHGVVVENEGFRPCWVMAALRCV